ncbi:hypothetical protein J1605_008599 [Eschrichtius robustus]|uniref:G-protein coupled receptors family 2 profile 1 domain-containing protein n=1 Tax=Eschrichtius robustus TaxID=9764 RepID=A0AB34H0B5_ESCRO|nr:hypothetical protein J1605_008599 [Eschrichtius robustus]
MSQGEGGQVEETLINSDSGAILLASAHSPVGTVTFFSLGRDEEADGGWEVGLQQEECDFMQMIEVQHNQCLEEAQLENETTGCSKMWDNLTCWPATPRGQVVVLACPLIFKLFSPIQDERKAALPQVDSTSHQNLPSDKLNMKYTLAPSDHQPDALVHLAGTVPQESAPGKGHGLRAPSEFLRSGAEEGLQFDERLLEASRPAHPLLQREKSEGVRRAGVQRGSVKIFLVPWEPPVAVRLGDLCRSGPPGQETGPA